MFSYFSLNHRRIYNLNAGSRGFFVSLISRSSSRPNSPREDADEDTGPDLSRAKYIPIYPQKLNPHSPGRFKSAAAIPKDPNVRIRERLPEPIGQFLGGVFFGREVRKFCECLSQYPEHTDAVVTFLTNARSHPELTIGYKPPAFYKLLSSWTVELQPNGPADGCHLCKDSLNTCWR